MFSTFPLPLCRIILTGPLKIRFAGLTPKHISTTPKYIIPFMPLSPTVQLSLLTEQFYNVNGLYMSFPGCPSCLVFQVVDQLSCSVVVHSGAVLASSWSDLAWVKTALSRRPNSFTVGFLVSPLLVWLSFAFSSPAPVKAPFPLSLASNLEAWWFEWDIPHSLWHLKTWYPVGGTLWEA